MRAKRTGTSGREPNERGESPLSFTRYCRDRLGLTIPIGGSARGQWYSMIEEEMEVQGWSWDDLYNAVDYVAEEGKVLRSMRGILYFVDEARRERSMSHTTDLHVKVAEALAVEEDSYWRRRLSLAKGETLARVYEEWKEHNEI